MTERTKNSTVGQTIDEALAELDTAADELRVKLHLAGMDARDTWERSIEPRIATIRHDAQIAKKVSQDAIEETLRAIRSLAAAL